MVPPKLTMKQKEREKSVELAVERNDKGEVIMPRYNCVTTHTTRRSGITNMYLTHKYTIVQMMHVSGHKTQKTFMDYIKLSSDEIDAIANGTKSEVFWTSCALTYAPTCALMVAYAQVDIINGQNRIFF